MLRYFSELKFRGRGNLEKMVDAIRTCLLCDEDLPVKVEAALALQMLIADQEKGGVFFRLDGLPTPVAYCLGQDIALPFHCRLLLNTSSPSRCSVVR